MAVLTSAELLARLQRVRERLISRHGAIERSAALYGFDQAYEAAQHDYYPIADPRGSVLNGVSESAVMQATAGPFDDAARGRARDILADAFNGGAAAVSQRRMAD